ncbi:HEXXH motif domain-containing protein [Streptomyces sp. NPDC050287]|uniref:HEXXH motif domain-containing protein n=1 Tax=Streptomyces sp. NPDC050287 TaxID=3365608 RepID=UPI003794427B
MPGHLFAELATGGGSPEALAFLERGERARRLLLLRTLHAHLDSLPAPLSPPADLWRTLVSAAGQDPEAVDRLLLVPQVGGWLAHVLRQLHGTAQGPPLWAETGRLGALAITAALLARTEADLVVPLVDGALHLPGLGTARLTDPGTEPVSGRARTSGGELTLTVPASRSQALATSAITLTCRPDTVSVHEETAQVEEGPRWIPLRTLTHHAPEGTVAIPLDDLDPYRDLGEPVTPARLDGDEAAVWQDMFDEAAALLTGPGREPGPGRLDPSAIRAVVPWGRTSVDPPPSPDVRVSATSGDSYAAMLIARPASAVSLAETLVHEFQHSKLAALLHLFPLLDDDRAERYYAPWRADPRHLTGLLHGAYAFTGVAGFWRDRLSEPEHAETAAYHFALRRVQSRLVVRTLQTSGRLTAQGRALAAGLARTLDDWLREPVDPAALFRARTAAALHRTEWRLRNAGPPDAHGEGAASTSRVLVLRADRTSWPDVRTHAFAERPAVPRTADEYLAVGDAATALDLYADALSADPADPHVLAGWIVARSALSPGRDSRRMLARPELLQPRPV